MTAPACGTLAEVLACSTVQLEYVTKRIHEIDVTADDLETLAVYMVELAEHGCGVAAVAEREITRSPQGHPVRDAHSGGDVQVSISHARALFDAIGTFAQTARDGAAQWTDKD
jgi:hypothetical protein